MIAIKKRQVYLALFLFLYLVASHGEELCVAQGPVEKAYVERVVDGDTLHLRDGRKVRLIGLDTPELDHQHGQHQAHALAARDFLRGLFGEFVYLQRGKAPQDHYGRQLYYLFDPQRRSLTSQLLSAGLGYRIAIPPNLAYQQCFAQAEQAARQAQQGVWQRPASWQAKSGFIISQLQVTSVRRNRGGWWLQTDQPVVIHLPYSALDYWTPQTAFVLEGKLVEARGWQHQRHYQKRPSRWILTVRHPLDLVEIHH